MESKSTSNIQSKCNSRKLCLNQSKLPLNNLSTILENVLTQETSIATASTIVIAESKTKKNIPKLSLIEASNRHKNEDFVIGKASLLIEQEPTKVEDIPTESSPTEIPSSENISEVNQQERVDSNSPNVFSVDWSYTLYNLRQSP